MSGDKDVVEPERCVDWDHGARRAPNKRFERRSSGRLFPSFFVGRWRPLHVSCSRLGMSASSHLDHLTDSDLALLAEAAGAAGGIDPADLRGRADLVVALLAELRVFDALFCPTPGTELVVRTSPFLAFACLVERAACDLRTTSSVAEPVGRRRWVPVFDADQLRGFMAAAPRRLFLAELMTSYTRVASGAVYVRQRRRWRRRRFSDLDLGQLARMLEIVPESERPGVYRRLGDLALFLTGVFPEACHRPLTSAPATERALRAAGVAAEPANPRDSHPTTLAYLERVGARCYLQACAGAAFDSPALAVVREVADDFSHARRVLNFITDRYLFATRDRWFPPAS